MYISLHLLLNCLIADAEITQWADKNETIIAAAAVQIEEGTNSYSTETATETVARAMELVPRIDDSEELTNNEWYRMEASNRALINVRMLIQQIMPHSIHRELSQHMDKHLLEACLNKTPVLGNTYAHYFNEGTSIDAGFTLLYQDLATELLQIHQLPQELTALVTSDWVQFYHTLRDSSYATCVRRHAKSKVTTLFEKNVSVKITCTAIKSVK